MPSRNLAIDAGRLRRLLDGINAFGFNPQTGGYNRPGYSQADMAVREWFMEEMRGSGLNVRRDAVANLFGRFGPADGPCIVAGSHLDTVPEGGGFDGALGVAVALECVRTIRDAGLRPSIAIEVVATAEEEGRFGGMLGSQAITGTVSREWLEEARDADGVSLTEAMTACGLDPLAALVARREDIHAFIELHIEQGPVLESRSIPLGIVHSIAGVVNLAVTLEGEANHSGTTPMDMRADAFAGLAAVGSSIPKIVADHGGPDTRVTIGKVDLSPNFMHTIPGKAVFIVNLRDTDEVRLSAVEAMIRTAIDAAARANRLKAATVEQSRLAPVRLDPELGEMLHEEARRLDLEAPSMPSGAGHDAQTMQGMCPAALIFVPSRGGISHAPQEHTDWLDVEKGANLMLAALVRLSGAA